MPRRIATASLVLVVAMLAGLALTPITLVVVSGEHGPIACARTTVASEITLTFTHSMYGGDVSESFRRGENGTLDRTAILTDNAAAAEYYAWTGEVRTVGDRFEVVAPPASFTVLPFRIDHIGNHRLTVDGRTWHLAEGIEGTEAAVLALESRPLVTQLAGTRC